MEWSPVLRDDTAEIVTLRPLLKKELPVIAIHANLYPDMSV